MRATWFQMLQEPSAFCARIRVQTSPKLLGNLRRFPIPSGQSKTITKERKGR